MIVKPKPQQNLARVAVLDWYSRKVLLWRVSITMDVHFCTTALEEAIARYGIQEIMNTDHGSQFTSQAFLGGSKNTDGPLALVIIPFLAVAKSRCHAAFSICFGGKPPLALLGRS